MFLNSILASFGVGKFSFEYIEPFIQKFGYMMAYQNAVIYFQTYGIYIILIAGFSPIPYKVFTIAAGMMSMALFPFIVFSLIARGARYFLISFLVRKFGIPGRIIKKIDSDMELFLKASADHYCDNWELFYNKLK